MCARPRDESVNQLIATGPLAAAADRLAQRYANVVPADVVYRTLVEVYTTLASGSTVTGFLPILAERATANRLDAVVRHPSTATPS